MSGLSLLYPLPRPPLSSKLRYYGVPQCLCMLALSYCSITLALSLFLVFVKIAYKNKLLKLYHYLLLALDIGIISYYHCALLTQVLTFLEVPEVYSHLAGSFLLLGVLLSSHCKQADESETRALGFLCGYTLMAYGLGVSLWTFLPGALLYYISLCKICTHCKSTNLTFMCFLGWQIGVLAGGVYFGIFWKYVGYVALEFLLGNIIPIASRALTDVDFLVKLSARFSMCLWNREEQWGRELDCVNLNLALSLLRKHRERLMPQILEYVLRYDDIWVIAHITRGNCYFLQEGLLSYPYFPLLVQLYRAHHNLIRRQGRRRAFLVRLKEVKQLPGSPEAREVAWMLELLERTEAKLGVLWLSSKRGSMERLPSSLWLDLVEYL